MGWRLVKCYYKLSKKNKKKKKKKEEEKKKKRARAKRGGRLGKCF